MTVGLMLIIQLVKFMKNAKLKRQHQNAISFKIRSLAEVLVKSSAARRLTGK